MSAPPAISDEAKNVAIAEAKKLLNIAADDAKVKVDLTLLANGATGQTFKLEVQTEGSSDEAKNYVARTIRPTRPDDAHLANTGKTLESAGVGPKVIASSETLVINEFVSGKPASVVDLGDHASPKLAAVANAVAKLHKIPTSEIEGIKQADDEFEYWMKILHERWAEKDATVPEALLTTLESAVETAKTYAKEIISTGGGDKKDGAQFAKLLSEVTTTHGDLHPMNILIEDESNLWIVDHERVAPRMSGYDIAYLFMVWGDLRYYTGFAPSAEEPGPYAQYESRVAFAKSYLAERTGKTDYSDADIADFLYEVEKFGYVERVRLFIIWLVLAYGDTNHMLVGAVGMYAPNAPHFKAMMEDDSAKEDVVKRGVIVATTAKLAAAAAAAAAATAAEKKE